MLRGRLASPKDFWSTRDEDATEDSPQEEQGPPSAFARRTSSTPIRRSGRSSPIPRGAPETRKAIRQRSPAARCTSAEPQRVEARYRWKSSYPSELDQPRIFDPSRASSLKFRLSGSLLPGNGTPDPLYPEPLRSVFMRRTSLEAESPGADMHRGLLHQPKSLAVGTWAKCRLRSPGAPSPLGSSAATRTSSPSPLALHTRFHSQALHTRRLQSPLHSRPHSLLQHGDADSVGEDEACCQEDGLGPSTREGLLDLDAALNILQVAAATLSPEP